MLSSEVMGIVALGVMWLSTALILATAASDALHAYRRTRQVGFTLGLGALCCAGILGAAVGITAMALTRPLFGPWSTAGGALGLAFFLLVQPLGVVLRRFFRRMAPEGVLDAANF